MIGINKMKKYAYYTLGVGLLLVGAAQMSPAEKSMSVHKTNTMLEKERKSPLLKSKKNNSTKMAHQRAYNSMSPKNKSVFHTLSVEDKKRVVDAHQNGKDHQHEMTHILEEDADKHENTHAQHKNETPAQKAMRAHTKNDGKQNIYD